MKIVIPDGSGPIGSLLSRSFGAEDHEVVVLTRRPAPIPTVRVIQWDGRTPGRWVEEVDGADVVINLAGRSVKCRYNKHNLTQMLRSRVESTEAVGVAIAQAGVGQALLTCCDSLNWLFAPITTAHWLTSPFPETREWCSRACSMLPGTLYSDRDLDAS